MDGYCERHQRAFEIKRVPGSWTYECPECRQEGRYDMYMTNHTEMLPIGKWTVSNRTDIYGRTENRK